jgi:hypothetical protein
VAGFVIDQPIALVCTGYGGHPVRELAVLIALCPWADEGAPNLAEALRFEVADSNSTRTRDGLVTKNKSEARIVNTPGVGPQLAFRGCPSCHEPARLLPVAAVVALAQAEREAAKTRGPDRRVDLDLRPATRTTD